MSLEIPSTTVEDICALATQSLRRAGLSNVTVDILRPTNLEQATELVVSTFLAREPLSRTLRTWKDSSEAGLTAWVRYVCAKAADAELSVIVKAPGGRIVFALINHLYDSSDTMELPGAEPFVDILSQLSVPYAKSPLPSAPAVEIACAAGAADWQQHDFLALSLQVTAELAKRMVIQDIMTKATSHSQVVARRMGFVTLGEVSYKDYSWRGDHVFASIETPKSAKLMWVKAGDVKDERGRAKL